MESDKSDTTLTIIMILLTIMLSFFGIFLQKYIPVIQFLLITVACGIIVYVLIWLPKRTSEYVKNLIDQLDHKIENILKFDKDNQKEMDCIQNRVNDLCVELTQGTEQRMSWTYFWASVRNLKDSIQADAEFKPDIILSIGRSGAIVGSIIAGNMQGLMHLGIDRINQWVTEGNRSSRTVLIFPSPRIFASSLTDKKILCVMSECDSGRTLEAVVSELNEIKGIKCIKTAVLFRNANTYFCPDYIAKEDQGERPKFPFKTSDWKDDSKLPHN